MKSQTSINSLLSQLNKLKTEVQELRQRVQDLEEKQKQNEPFGPAITNLSDTLNFLKQNIKEVKKHD